jgi:hypothetical protein
MELCNVVETVVAPNAEPITNIIAKRWPKVRAVSLRDKLNDKLSTADFDPNRLVSYVVEPVS